MQIINSREAQNNFGNLLDTARREPVTVNRHGRPIVVVLSTEEFARLQALEDAVWAAQAQEAAKEGLLGPAESVRVISQILSLLTQREDIDPLVEQAIERHRTTLEKLAR